jgi:CNP1-like family
MWLLASAGAFAQLAPQDPDWKEVETPAPPAFSRDKLLPLEMPNYTALKFGVDPATLSVSTDRVVRYVVVATSSTGVVNAMYEGLRCDVGEFKTYARWSARGEWATVKDPSWRPLTDNNISRHALAFARQGACEGRAAAAGSAAEIVRRLRASASVF